MTKLRFESKRRTVDVPESDVDRYLEHGWVREDASVDEEGSGELVYPDPGKANHDAIDKFAADHEVAFDGIDASDPAKPTKAEKVAHLQKVISARESD